MTESTELTTIQSATVAEMLAKRQLLETFFSTVMVPGKHYGIIPGTKTPSLLKTGAEFLRMAFHLEVEMEITTREVDWGSGLVSIDSRCTLRDVDGRVVGQADANANSLEAKFHWRWVGEKYMPSHIDKSTLTWREQSSRYGTYKEYRVPNEEVGDLLHVVTRYSEKRCFVAAIHQATGASVIFSEVLDDDQLEMPKAKRQPAPAGARTEAKPPAAKPAAAAPQKPPEEQKQPQADATPAPEPEKPQGAKTQGKDRAVSGKTRLWETQMVDGIIWPVGAISTLGDAFQGLLEVYGVAGSAILQELGVRRTEDITMVPRDVYSTVAGPRVPREKYQPSEGNEQPGDAA